MRRLAPLALLAACAPLPVQTATTPDPGLELGTLFGHIISIQDPTGWLLGSGVVIADGVVVTAGHVAADLPPGRATIHPEFDVAVIRMETGGKTAAQIAPESTQLGEKVFLVAFTENGSQVVTGGLTGFNRFSPNQKLHSCEGSPGTSGGGMFNRNGRLVGIQLGCLLTQGARGPMPVYSDPEGRYLPVEAWAEWALGLL